MSVSDWIQAGGIVAAAFIAVMVAISQARLQGKQFRFQVKAARYEKRLSVFLSVMRYLGTFAKIGEMKLLQLQKDTVEAEFLFDEDVSEFILQIYRNSNQLHQCSEMLKQAVGEERRRELELKKNELENWLVTTAFEAAKAKFVPYLKFEPD